MLNNDFNYVFIWGDCSARLLPAEPRGSRHWAEHRRSPQPQQHVWALWCHSPGTELGGLLGDVPKPPGCGAGHPACGSCWGRGGTLRSLATSASLGLCAMLAAGFQSAPFLWQMEVAICLWDLHGSGEKFNELDSNLVEIVLGWLALPLGKVPPGCVSTRCHVQRCSPLPHACWGGCRSTSAANKSFPGL